MSANSASRHLRLAVSAAALLLAGTQFDGSMANAEPAADLDTLIMASLQNSGRSDASSAAKQASKNPDAKASAGKSRAAKKRPAKKPAETTLEPSVVQIAPQQGGGGLLAAIGAVGSGSMPTADVKPLPSRIATAPVESKVDRSPLQSGPSVYVTSGYGQSERQSEPSLAVVQQTPSFAFSAPAPAAGELKPDKAEKLASASKANKSDKTAPKETAAVVVPPVAETPAQPSGLGAFFASLGFGESASSRAREVKADAAPLPASSAGMTTAAKDSAKEPSKADAGVFAIIGPLPENSKSASKSSIAKEKSASGISPAPAASVTGSVTPSTAAAKPASPDRSISSSKSASIDPHSKGGAQKPPKTDVATTSSISSSAIGGFSVAKPAGSDNTAAPTVAAAESAPARESTQAPASQSGGLFAAFGVSGGSEPSPVETTAQIAVAYPEPVPVKRSPSMPPREMAISPSDPAYRVDAGDKLRVVVYGQDGLTNSYAIDAGGGITMPLIGRVAARGLTPAALAADITARLRKGFIREPSVAVEIEAYRPFFILGEVAAPGQYPYVPNMSVEAAVAIAGGFSPRARRDSVTLTHRAAGGQYRESVPLGTSLNPGDTITVGERWF